MKSNQNAGARRSTHPHEARGTKGSLQVRAYKGRPFYEARWRDMDGVDRRRRLGPAWIEQDEDGNWVKHHGRVHDGWIEERRAYSLMAEVIEEHEERLRLETPPKKRDALFDDAVAAWLSYLKTERRAKPSTLRGYEALLAKPDAPRRRRGRKRAGRRIMASFGGRQLFDISVKDVRSFLARLDREDLTPRTVNHHRQVLHAIFEFARREESFGLPTNPATETARRPEDGTKPVDTFEPAEIRAVAAVAKRGLHRRHPGYANSVFSPECEREWQRINDQDASLFLIAAATGLRRGELAALRWRDIDLERRIVTVSRAISAGEETSTKSRRSRIVPLAAQARVELEQLGRRPHFTGREDLVFVRPDGGPLDQSAMRTRFIRAQVEAGIRRRRFHDLRHTFGSLAIRRFDVLAVKEMMGHASLTTTERYLHSKPRPTDAAKLTAIFEDDGDEDRGTAEDAKNDDETR